MDEPDLKRITRVLQIEAERIALEATAQFTLNWPGMNDRRSMVLEGYVRLGGVVALSVFVSEPGLIAEDLRWVKGMFAARGLNHPFGDMVQGLLQAYVQACSIALNPDEIRVVADIVDRAGRLLRQDAENS